MLQDVIDALRRKDPAAVALARAEVEATPDSADAHHLLGMAQRDAGDLTGARASFDRAIELSPDESLYHFSRAVLAYTQGDVAVANRASAHAIALDPNQLGAYVLRIQIALADGDFAEAERQLNIADRVDPDHPRLLFAAGQIALAKGEIDRATELLSHAATARPDDAQVLAALATAYIRNGNPAFAEQALRKAMTLDPGSNQLRPLLIEALMAQGHGDEASAELAIHRSHYPQDPVAATMEAELKLRNDDAMGALAGFRAALALAPRDMRILQGTEQALNAIGDRALGRKVWSEAVQLDPAFDMAWGALLGVIDDRDEFADVLQRWRKAVPDSLAAILNQARKDETEGRAAEAQAGYDAVLAREPQQPEALFGKAMFDLGKDPAAAIARLDQMIANAPKFQSKPALAMRGLIRNQLDDVVGAVVDWQQAHIGLGSLPPAVELPSDALHALPLPSDSSANNEGQVVMLWGPPGSGDDRLAAVLRFAPSRPLMLDASQEMLPRVLQFDDQFIALATNAEELPAFAESIATDYAQSVDPYVKQGNLGVIEWIARWDARIVPVFRQALPGLRLIAAMRDPRDLLLNWLAFGAPAGPAFVDPMANAAWLANQLEHLLFSRDVLQLPVLIVDMDQFDADAASAMQSIATFAGLPTAPDPQPALWRRTGQGGLPTLLPAGRWHAYAEEFGEAFATLTPLAARLGYPIE